ncbi:HrpE/YscL family type III secretion apparatus protein [Paraherbaspirillum soli]|uniref:HrpE/YscL family type III secretion apparatus protein n=1 Tax=Paraherbaspirillum soli TaxID=631222 RepID=A0ABW0M7P4_9BURK
MRATAIAVTSDAAAAAAAIMEDAKAQAQALCEQASADAQAAVHEAERNTFEQAGNLLQSLEQRHAVLLDGAQQIVVDLAQGLFERLVAELTPRERIAAALRRLLVEAPPKLVAPTLRVHPDDVELLPPIDWALKADPGMTHGCCRLEADSGEWHVSFDAAVAALKSALSKAVAESSSDDEAGR